MRGNNISLVLLLAAVTFFAVLQWNSGRNGPNEAVPETAAATAIAAADEGVDDAPCDATPELAPADTSATPAAAGQDAAQPRSAQTPRATDQPTPTANAPPSPTPAPARASDLPTIAYAELPPEAHDTIALIESDGPFPFSRDGATFQNRERLLPRHPEGYYREYTVITPGARDRGARRIVTGDGGEMYYTDDHYASFREIIRE